jgi:hypothetical protein
MDRSQLIYFISEREAIRHRRAASEPPPWTADPILQTWSFTNIRREDDRVTRWVATHRREPHYDDPDLWFAMCLARFINWPDTLAELGYPAPWNREHFLAVMAARTARGAKLYGPAYMIHADNKNRGRCTAEYQAADVFNPLWRVHEFLYGLFLVRPEFGRRRSVGGVYEDGGQPDNREVPMFNDGAHGRETVGTVAPRVSRRTLSKMART